MIFLCFFVSVLGGGFFPSSWAQIDAVTEHVITVGLFWFCFVGFFGDT